MSHSKRAERTDSSTVIPVNLGKPSLRLRLEAYYKLISPEVTANQADWRTRFEQIWAKFGGTLEGENRLAKKLTNKYGASVRLLLTESNESSSSAAARSSNTTAQHDEQWYATHAARQRGSKVLDFSSNDFDAEAVIRSKEQQVTKANPFLSKCSLLDHLGKSAIHLPACDPLHRTPTAGLKRSRVSTFSTSKDAIKIPRNLPAFAALAHASDKGPLSLLHQAFHKRWRVRVLIRYVNSIRGTLTGILLAYDKHMNMILKDVEEVYTPRVSKELLTTTSSNVDSELRRRLRALNNFSVCGGTPWSVRRRHLKQLLVRGDNVVIVYRAESERSAWPKTSKSPTSSYYESVAPVIPESPARVGTPGSLIYAHQRGREQR